MEAVGSVLTAGKHQINIFWACFSGLPCKYMPMCLNYQSQQAEREYIPLWNAHSHMNFVSAIISKSYIP